MLSSGNNLSRGTATSSSDIPSLTQCLPLEQIALGNQKYRSAELRKVLGATLGSVPEDCSFGAAHLKPPQSMATEKLKHVKEGVKDRCRTARVRANKMHDSLQRLEKFQQQRNELVLNERSNGTSMTKLVNQIHRNSQDMMGQRSEDRAKSVGLNKRVRTSAADVQGDGRSIHAPRQQTVTEKDGDMLQNSSVDTVWFEEKIRRLPAGGEGWDTKNKKKRSVGVSSGKIVKGDRDLKRAMNSKITADSKLRSCDAQGFRSKSSSNVGGVNKLDGSFETSGSDTSKEFRNDLDNATLTRDRLVLFEQKFVTEANGKPINNEDCLVSSPNTVIKAKASRAPRTGSIKMLDSSLKFQSSLTCLQDAEKPRSSAKVAVPGLINNHKRQISAGSSSMAQWVGQRPHKNSRTRRANIVAPVSNPIIDVHISSQGFQVKDNATPKFKREFESDTSVYEFSESEESGAGENKHRRKADSGELAFTATQKVGSFLLPSTKNKLPAYDNIDGVRRQGRSGRGLSIARNGNHNVTEQLHNLPPTKVLQHVKPASDKNKRKTGRPPSKKLKDRKSLARIGPLPDTPSVDFTGASDDDHEELFVAANSARMASDHACCGSFWKKMESLFASVSAEDMSYLKQQLTFAEELDESLSQMLGGECNVLGVLKRKEAPDYSSKKQGADCNQECLDNSIIGKVDMGTLEKGAPLYQRVLSALIEEDETEEFYIHDEGKSMLLQYASDDSHCGSCNLIDIEVKDRDRMESEVESGVNLQKNSFFDRISCDKNFPSMSSSLRSNEQWPGDDESLHPDIVYAGEICLNDLGHPQARELYISGFSCSDNKYQTMCLDDRVLLELQSIGLFPETLPDLQEGENVINQDILELKEQLYNQIGRKKWKLGNIDKAVQKGKDVERRKIEQIAMDQLIEMAYRKRLACRGNNSSKSGIRKVSREGALSFIKRTLARCTRFENTGHSCFSEPALQEVIFSTTPTKNDAKSSVDCVGSGTASNTFNETRGSVAASTSFDYLVSSTPDSAKGPRNSVSGSPLDGLKSEQEKTKQKLEQKTLNHSNNKMDREVSGPKEADEPIDLGNMQLNELDSIVSNDQDLGTWLSFDEDGLQDHDSIGLAIPMDDLTELSMLM